MKSKGIVYSTDQGRTCSGCGHPITGCCCSKGSSQPKVDGIVRVSRQTKGRKCNGVCLITGLPLIEAEIVKIAKLLKKRCGAGGAVKNGVIEIQGDHRAVLVNALKEMGYAAKLAGG